MSAPFTLSRATPTDFPSIITTQYLAFTDSIVRNTFMGPDTASNKASLASRYAKTAADDFGDYWIKVCETSTGNVVAACNWKIYPSALPEHKPELDLPWLEGDDEALEMAREIKVKSARTRGEYMTEPYVELNICFTAPAYQRRGIGKMMMEWGCRLGDQLFLPMWVHASPEGNLLYKVHGFRDLEKSEGDLSGSWMRRDARTEPVYGGKE